MGKLRFRLLRAEEIECRVNQMEDTWCSLLLYKDARVDQRLLDEVVGPINWCRSHQLIGDSLFCTVGVRDSSGEWVYKQDVGTKSNTEAEKGQASDSFKRACFNWGIGRELYTAPRIIVSLTPEDFNNKKRLKTSFEVKKIQYDSQRNISYLMIVDNNGAIKKSYGKEKVLEANSETYAKVVEMAKNGDLQDNVRMYFSMDKATYEQFLKDTQLNTK